MKTTNQTTLWIIVSITLIAIIAIVSISIEKQDHRRNIKLQTNSSINTPSNHKKKNATEPASRNNTELRDVLKKFEEVPPIDPRQYFSNPETYTQLHDNTIPQIEDHYGEFLGNLEGYTMNQIQSIRDSLINSKIEDLYLGFAPLSTMTPEEIIAHFKDVDSIRKIREQNIAQKLNPRDAKRLIQYQKTLPYRDNIKTIANRMRSNGTSINSETQTRMLSIYTNAIHSAAQQTIDKKPGKSSPNQLYNEFDIALVKSMSEILNKTELDAFIAAHISTRN